MSKYFVLKNEKKKNIAKYNGNYVSKDTLFFPSKLFYASQLNVV